MGNSVVNETKSRYSILLHYMYKE